MKLILITFSWGFAASECFADRDLDPSVLSWIKSLDSQTKQIIEDYQEEVAAMTQGSCQIADKLQSSQQCPQKGLDANSEGREPLSKFPEESLRNINDLQNTRQQNAKHIPELLVFVSFSMNQKTLKSLAQSLKKVGGSLVFRGLVKYSFQETAKAFQELGEEALIDPTLFRNYQITTVPTFILREVEDDFHASPAFDKVCGNITLDAALVLFANKGEVHKHAQVLLHHLRGEN